MSTTIRPLRRTRPRSIGGSPRPATIDCGGACHRLSVRGTKLHTHDHDATAELALHGRGGGLRDCLVYELVWRQSFTEDSWSADTVLGAAREPSSGWSRTI